MVKIIFVILCVFVAKVRYETSRQILHIPQQLIHQQGAV